MKTIYHSLSQYLSLAVAFFFGATILSLQSCDQNEIENVKTSTDSIAAAQHIIELPDSLTPYTIEIEMREGHSHLPQGEAPNRGDLLWSTRNSGFHANPYFKDGKYPFKSFQRMILVRQADGSYKIDTKHGVDAFRVQTSPTKGGIWNALLVYMYDKNDNRIDLKFRTPEMQKLVQMFYTVSQVKPIAQTIPAGVLESDTTLIIDKKSELPDSTLEALKAAGYGGPIPVRYKTDMLYTDTTSTRDVFYYWYYDRATDDIDRSPILHTPLGFRGVFANKAPFASYNVNMMLSVLPEGSSKGAHYVSDRPSVAQMKHLAFNIQIPFRNIMEKIDTHAYVPSVVQNIVDKADKYYIEFELYKMYYNVGLHINVMREYPGYSMQQLRDWYNEQLRNFNPEASNFWL